MDETGLGGARRRGKEAIGPESAMRAVVTRHTTQRKPRPGLAPDRWTQECPQRPGSGWRACTLIR